MLYENYGLNILGNAQSIKITTDGTVSFYFADRDIRDRALGRIRSVLKIEGILPVSELCKYHQLLSADEHDSDRGWTKEDLDNIKCGRDPYSKIDSPKWVITLPPSRQFGYLNPFKRTYFVERSLNNGLRVYFTDVYYRDLALTAFTQTVITQRTVTVTELLENLPFSSITLRN